MRGDLSVLRCDRNFRDRLEVYDTPLVYFQGHASPGIYARAFVEGRLSRSQLENFRRELQPEGGLSSVASNVVSPGKVLQSSDKVRLGVSRHGQADGGRFEVRLEIDEGFHISANPASMEFLIPTSLIIEDAPGLDVSYPPGVTFSPEFTDDEIAVYGNGVVLSFELGTGRANGEEQWSGVIRVQACNERICLPPSNLPFTVVDGKLVAGKRTG